jgi:peptidoglycan/LPS O-acetylase OafA/YrhL
MRLSRPQAPLLGIEWVRFACTLPVLLWHYQHFFYVAGHPVGFEVAAQPGYAWLKPFYLYGYLSVQAFWGISGYIFFWKYAQAISQGGVLFSRFVWLRLSRLYPLHLITLLLVAGMSWWYERHMGAGFVYQRQDWPHFGLQLLMASDWGPKPDWSFNGPIWSISLELLVYLVFFGLCRLGLIRWWAVGTLIAGSGLVYGAKLTGHPVVLCLFFFYLGALTFLAHERLLRCSARQQGWELGVAWGLALGAIVLSATGVLRPMFLVALLVPVAIISLVQWVKPGSPRQVRTITTLGHLTYSSYLWHFPLQLAAALWFLQQPADLPARQGWWLAAYLGLTYAVAFASYRWIEAPAQTWLRGFMPAVRR